MALTLARGNEEKWNLKVGDREETTYLLIT